MTDSLECLKTTRGDYFVVRLGPLSQTQICCLKNWQQGELGDPFWWSPSPLDIPNPPLTWLKPVTQQAILDKLNLMVKITKMARTQAYRSSPYSSVWERGGDELIAFQKADDAWRKALCERFCAYSELGLDRPEE